LFKRNRLIRPERLIEFRRVRTAKLALQMRPIPPRVPASMRQAEFRAGMGKVKALMLRGELTAAEGLEASLAAPAPSRKSLGDAAKTLEGFDVDGRLLDRCERRAL
jgi:hypothetical protein